MKRNLLSIEYSEYCFKWQFVVNDILIQCNYDSEIVFRSDHDRRSVYSSAVAVFRIVKLKVA
jgi:hypothetical protein